MPPSAETAKANFSTLGHDEHLLRNAHTFKLTFDRLTAHAFGTEYIIPHPSEAQR